MRQPDCWRAGPSFALPNFNFEERGIGVLMTPVEVLLLLAAIHSVEIAIILMVLLKIGAVSTVFIIVPRVIVFAVAIVVPFFLMVSVLSSPGYRSHQRSAQYERTQK